MFFIGLLTNSLLVPKALESRPIKQKKASSDQEQNSLFNFFQKKSMTQKQPVPKYDPSILEYRSVQEASEDSARNSVMEEKENDNSGGGMNDLRPVKAQLLLREEDEEESDEESIAVSYVNKEDSSVEEVDGSDFPSQAQSLPTRRCTNELESIAERMFV